MSKTKLTKPTKQKDQVFREPQPVTDFEFGEKAASVFDDKLLENREMLLRAGFRYCDVFFKWYNFCGFVALK